MNALPLTRDLVLIGGGHTHALVLRKWGMNPLPGARLTLINPGSTAPYTGMLPGFVAGHYERNDLDIDLVKLARFAGARIIFDSVNFIDLAAKRVHVSDRMPIAYDCCSIDVGITSEMPDTEGFDRFGFAAKPLGAFADAWSDFLDNGKSAEIAVIGGGIAGAELSMAMSFALASKGKMPAIRLLDQDKFLSQVSQSSRERMEAELKKHNVEIIENIEIEKLTKQGVTLVDGRGIESSFTVGTAGARPYKWLSEIGLETHEGYVCVDQFLNSSDPSIFAVGDCAHMRTSPRPKAGVFAVRQAPTLYQNLRAQLSGGRLVPFKPQRDYLKLVSLGGKRAIAHKYGRTVSGSLMWTWKDRIDRKFMDQFRDLPQMQTPPLPQPHALGLKEALGDKPMCGGCGAKVGRHVLSDVLSDLPEPSRADVERVAGDDAGVIVHGKTKQVMTTDHLRSFIDDPHIMTKIAAVHALGDIWAMGATPQAVTVSIVLPRMSAALQKRTMEEVMAAAQEVIAAAGATIIGGHSSVGEEFTIGFTATGLVKGEPITIAGAQLGDALILTQPIGTGVIMAGEMAGRAPGRDVQSALEHMLQDQSLASEILSDAHAMTDVTGFGLAGHLDGICAASGVGADLSLGAIRTLNGASELSAAGVRSSLFDDNLAGVERLSALLSQDIELLFDPQTAGGLLAAIEPNQAKAKLSALIEAGYQQAAIIGHVNESGVITISRA